MKAALVTALFVASPVGFGVARDFRKDGKWDKADKEAGVTVHSSYQWASGGYESTLTNDRKSIAGQVDKKIRNIAWRIGGNIDTVCATRLANLTQDANTVAIHFGKDRVQCWLLVRMPESAPADQPPKAPDLNRSMPP